MTLTNKEDYIAFRFRRAEESLEEAIILSEKNRWNAVVNRLYYACFYAVTSLLLKNDIVSQTHQGTRNLFGLRFIKTGIIDKNQGLLFSKLFDKIFCLVKATHS